MNLCILKVHVIIFLYSILHFNVYLIFSYVNLPPKIQSTAGLVVNAIGLLTLLILNNAIVAPYVQCMLHYVILMSLLVHF